MSRQQVAMLCTYIPQYRLGFYNRLYELCKKNNIDLRVIYGEPNKANTMKSDAASFPPGTFIKNKFYSIGNTTVIWQPAFAHVRSADLLIVEQANKLLLNYLFLCRQVLGIQKLAFFGHGANFQATIRNKASEALKKRLAGLPHWWFAYTSGVAKLVEKTGYPGDRITIVNNAIDTRDLINIRADVKPTEIKELRARLGITSQNVCIYVGAMYAEKRIPFLLNACEKIRVLIPDFQMIFIGAGPDDFFVRKFCEDHPWAFYMGPLTGREKVKCFMISDLMLMPGAVGLVVLDTFALGVPIVTTEISAHGPEIDYIEDKHNGVIVQPAHDVNSYVSAVTDLLLSATRRATLVQECERTASLYTIEGMVDRVFHGILLALAKEP